MKKLYIILALVVVSILMVFAGDTVKILRVYHNGTYTAIPLANIDSIDHSRFGANGKFQPNYTSSIIETLDSIYYIPISEIDSVVVTKAYLNDFISWVENIQDYISTQGEIGIDSFQNRITTWLEKQDWVSETNINENLITISFLNGMKYYIDFEDTSFFEEDTEEQYDLARTRSGEEDEFWDVSSYDDDELIDEPRVIFYDCISQHWRFNLNAFNKLEEYRQSSPLNLYLDKEEKLSGFNKNFSKYGLVFISNTHGASDRKDGSFKVFEKTLPDGQIVYYNNLGERMVDLTDSPQYKWISPAELQKYIGNASPIVYGDYCWGYWISKSLNCPVIGYDTWSQYIINQKYITAYYYKIVNGETHDNAMKDLKPYPFRDTITQTLSNRDKYNKRYFSIKTNEITEEKGITGEIKGYKNFKDEIKDNYSDHFMLYVHKGTEKFTPKDIGVEKVKSVVKVKKADGTFTVSSDVIKEYPNCGFIVGFEYSGKVYYGEMIKEGIHLCPDDNHPHIIDLGLPSGTKWLCCNIGANAPEIAGGYFAWGETVERSFFTWNNYKYKNPSYSDDYCLPMGNISGTVKDVAYVRSMGQIPIIEDIVELDENCDIIEYVINGVEGKLFTGKNGNKLFIPLIYNENDSHGHCYWLGDESPLYTNGLAYAFSPQGRRLYTQLEIPKYWGCTVRSVVKQTK